MLNETQLAKWKRYFEARQEGHQAKTAASLSGLSPATAYRFERGEKSSSGIEAAQTLGITDIGTIRVPKKLCPEAERALTDFAYFRLRYFGRTSDPWQVEAAEIVLADLETDEKEYDLINAPPGAGKSTLFTHDIPVWLICRDRNVRIGVGSRTHKQATKYSRRIRRTLEATTVMRATSKELEKGWAVDGVAVLSEDYGLFQSGRAELWTASEFNVLLERGATAAKEATVTAYGMDGDYLGGRFDVFIWDDLVDRKTTRSATLREELEERWDTEMETRIEPGGIMVLQGQRIAAEDLYKYNLLKMKDDGITPFWRHIKFPAHFDHLCSGEHSRSQQPYPNSCLLSPRRIGWEQLAPIRKNKPRVYKVIYQQEDTAAQNVLIPQLHIDGGTDHETHLEYPGCKDFDRALGVVPDHLRTHVGWSVVTVDPSPTLNWSVQWWGYHVGSQNRYLLNHHRGLMTTTDFLTMDLDSRQFGGLLHEWVLDSRDKGYPITHVIVEQNAAQRFMLQNPIYQRWQDIMSVVIIPHDTHRANKSSDKYGVESLQAPYATGHYRLPWADDPDTRAATLHLTYELTHWPEVTRTDCLMANWFFEYSLATVWAPPSHGAFSRPQWVSETASRGLTRPPGDSPRDRLYGRVG